jgi:hypothetical protein
VAIGSIVAIAAVVAAVVAYLTPQQNVGKDGGHVRRLQGGERKREPKEHGGEREPAQATTKGRPRGPWLDRHGLVGAHGSEKCSRPTSNRGQELPSSLFWLSCLGMGQS